MWHSLFRVNVAFQHVSRNNLLPIQIPRAFRVSSQQLFLPSSGWSSPQPPIAFTRNSFMSLQFFEIFSRWDCFRPSVAPHPRKYLLFEEHSESISWQGLESRYNFEHLCSDARILKNIFFRNAYTKIYRVNFEEGETIPSSFRGGEAQFAAGLGPCCVYWASDHRPARMIFHIIFFTRHCDESAETL